MTLEAEKDMREEPKLLKDITSLKIKLKNDDVIRIEEVNGKLKIENLVSEIMIIPASNSILIDRGMR